MPRSGWGIDEVGPALYLLANVRKARGAVSLTSIVLLLVLAGAGYVAWTFVPMELDNLDVREACSSAFNRLANDPDTDRVRNYLLDRTKRIGTHWEGEGGTRIEKPGLGLTEADIVIQRDASEHSARVQLDYQREAKLWPTDRFASVDFHVEKAGKLPQ
jgi:hypothetical protein